MGKNLSLFIVFSLCLVSFSGRCRAEAIKIGYFESKPHMYRSATTGKAAGASVIYFEMLAKEAGFTVEWVGPLPFSRMMDLLQKGTILDGTPLMSQNSAREKFLYFVTKPFYMARPNFALLREYPLDRITSPDEVKGMVIGQFHKAASSRFVTDNLSIFRFDKLATGDSLFSQQLRKLMSGRVDAIHTLDEYTLRYEAIRLNQEQQIKLLFLPEDPWPFYTVFCRTEKGKKIVERFNLAFEKTQYRKEMYHEMIQEEFKAIRLLNQ